MNQHEFNTLLIDFVRDEDVLYHSQNLNFTNSGERHLAYERIAEKLRQHGKLKWRYMKEHQVVENGKRAPNWPYYQSLSFLLPSVLELERKRMNTSVPEDGQGREQQQYVEVQACDVVPSTSTVQKGRSQKRKSMMFEETDNRLMEKRRVTNLAFAEFVACKLDEMPEPIRSHTERQIIDLVMSVHVETYQEISQSNIQQMHATDRELPIAAEIYHPSGPEPVFENCQPIPTTRPRGRSSRKLKIGE